MAEPGKVNEIRTLEEFNNALRNTNLLVIHTQSSQLLQI